MALRGIFSYPNLDQMDWERKREEEKGANGRERESVGFLKRETLPSLKNFRRSDRRAPTRQEAKLLPTARTTRGYQF